MKKNIYSNLFIVIVYKSKLNFGFKYNYKLYNIVGCYLFFYGYRILNKENEWNWYKNWIFLVIFDKYLFDVFVGGGLII